MADRSEEQRQQRSFLPDLKADGPKVREEPDPEIGGVCFWGARSAATVRTVGRVNIGLEHGLGKPLRSVISHLRIAM